MTKTKNIIISGTNFWNPGDDFVRDGIITILNEMFQGYILNFHFYNFNADFFPYTKFSGISNTVQAGDLDLYKNHIDYIVIAGLSAGVEIKDLYNWIIKNDLQDRVFMIGAGYENDYVDKYISQEPEATIFRNAKVITGRTFKRPKFIDQNNLQYNYINCPAILSVPEVKSIPANKKIEKIGFSIQLPKGIGILNQLCSPENYNLTLSILQSLMKNYQVEVVAHHKTEYFYFLEMFKNVNIPVIYSSYYQDLHKIYPRYDLVITTRLHSSLFANGFGIPGIIINDTDRHTHCLQGFPHSVWVNSMEKFEKEFSRILNKDLQKISNEAHNFKTNLKNKYIDILSVPFGVKKIQHSQHRQPGKLNLGCGFDYREGYINVDGNAKLPKVDLVLDIKPGALKKVFSENSLTEIVAKDFVEHHFHWEARELLEEFHTILDVNGKINITLPNIEMILQDTEKPIHEKLLWLYGGQDIGTPTDSDEQKAMRRKYSTYYCHKFGWTKDTIKKELTSIGYTDIVISDQGWNMNVVAAKATTSSADVSGKEKNTSEIEFFNSEKKEQLLVIDNVAEGMTVFDVGANIGKYTKLFSHIVGTKGKVYAFEPSAFAYKKLSELHDTQNLSNTEIINKAVYSENTSITLNEFPEEFCSWNSIGKPVMKKPQTTDEYVPIENSVEVEAITLDSFCKDKDITSIDYLKLDVEGAEIHALKGAGNLLRNKAIKYLQFEVSKQMLEGMNTTAKAVFDFLDKYGYTCYKITEDGEIGGKVSDSDEFYENYIAIPFKKQVKDLPVHFFTIVLNGQPFIENQIQIMQELPFKWHWHIMEGVAELKHDTSWSLSNGAKITERMHQNGLSTDGTSAFLDKIAKDYADQVTVYRKDKGSFWDGKLEMVNAPLSNIKEESLLWQLDVDEFWYPWQISRVREMFADQPDKNAAYFFCHFFVGENLITGTKNTYGNNTGYEWLRVWRFHPGNYFSSHEPPRLMHESETGQIFDKASRNIFRHDEMEENGLVFEHYAYFLEKQLRFKEDYYGYADAVKHWKNLQQEKQFPVFLKNYFPWVKDEAKVIPADYKGLQSMLKKQKDRWILDKKKLKNTKQEIHPLSYLNSRDNKRILWIRGDSIGDAVLSIDAITILKKRYKNVTVTVVCQNHIKEIYEEHPAVDEIVGFDRQKLLNDNTYQMQVVNELRKHKAFLAVNAVFSRDLVSDFLTLNSEAVFTLGFEGDNCNLDENLRKQHNILYSFLVPVSNSNLNELERNAALLSFITNNEETIKPRIFFNKEDEKFASDFFEDNQLDPQKVIVLFAGAQHDIKDYEKFGAVLNEICKKNDYSVLALGGSKEYNLNQKNLDAIENKSYNLCGNTTLRQASALVSRCLLAVGTDTSIGHIAAALNIPQVIVLGGGHYGRFMPIHSSTTVVSQPLDCYGCNWRCKFESAKCIKDISVILLRQAIENVLTQKSDKPTIYISNEKDKTYLEKYINQDTAQVRVIEIPAEKEIATKSSAAARLDLSQYYQPIAGDTEKFIAVNPQKSAGNVCSSFQTLKDYDVRDFGIGLDAILQIMGHVVINKFKQQWNGKSDFWLKTIVLPVKCQLRSAQDNSLFSEKRPSLPEDIHPQFIESDERRHDVLEYAKQLKNGKDLGMPLYMSGQVLNELMSKPVAEKNAIYMLDGARRISASALAHKDGINILLILHENEYKDLLPEEKLRQLSQKMNSLSWFKNYQSISLIGLHGERSTSRFSLFDVNVLKDQTVMDFGCNIGQASLKAIQAGAKKVIGVEGMADTFNLANDIKEIVGFSNLNYLNVDFNDQNFDATIDQTFPEKTDYSFFFSVYRTKELTQRERLFQYIIDKTTKGIFFEGHADPKIDSLEYYDWLFNSFGLKHQFLGYSEGNIRPLFFIPLQNISTNQTKDTDYTAPSLNISNELIATPASEHKYMVSAIVSTYNSEKFIEGKINDLLSQTIADKLEIIIIDSNSQQNEKSIIEKYQQKFNNIKYLRTENRETVYQAWNRGIKMASGKYLTNSNTDDRLRSDALQVMVDYLEAHPEEALVYADFYITGYDNQTFEKHIRTGYSIKPDFNPDIMLHGCHMGPQPVWRKSVHEKIGLFNEALKAAGDYEMWCRMVASGYKLKHLQEFLGLYLHNASGIVNSNQNLANQEAQAVRLHYKNALPEPAQDLPTGFYYQQPVQAAKYVNICMVTYNRLEFTQEALHSIMVYTRFPYVITVVDNASTDGTREFLNMLKEKGVIKNLILLDENVGVAKASNLAWMQEIGAAYYMKFDNDIVIQKTDWLKNMVDVADNVSDVGMVGYNFEPVSYPVSNLNGFNVRIKKPGNLGGACVLIPKSTEKLLGYWCEEYGLYSEEDADYGYRIELSALLNVYMEDENIGLHLPAGKAARIDQDDNYIAKDGLEEEVHKEYRQWKDEQRNFVVDGGLREKNFKAYREKTKPTFMPPSYYNKYNKKYSNADKQNQLGIITGPPKIGFLSIDKHNLACPYLRLLTPLKALDNKGLIEYVSLDLDSEMEITVKKLCSVDILIIQRNVPGLLPYEKLDGLLSTQLVKPKIVFEFDDAFGHVYKSHIAYDFYQQMIPTFKKYIENADLITVSTEKLKKYYAEDKNCIVLPNTLDEGLWHFRDKAKSKNDKIKILFSGTITHESDLKVIKEPLKRILKEYKNEVELYFWGDGIPEFTKHRNVKLLSQFNPDYIGYAKYLQQLDMDFAIVPLVDNAFNNAKSNIKWLEYSACEIPGIFSNVGEYNLHIKDKETGLLVKNTVNEWYRAIKWMIQNPEKRINIAKTAKAQVKENYTVQRNAEKWIEAYKTILNPGDSEAVEKQEKPAVSIIIPVFNKIEYTKKCIESILKNTNEGFEVLVVDNGSNDGTEEYFAEITKSENRIRYIKNPENLGFAAANNIAALKAKGEYLVFLNNDTEVQAGWLENMLKVAQNDEKVGAVGCKLLYPDLSIQHAGVVIVDNQIQNDPLQAQNIFVGEKRDAKDPNIIREYQAVTAACMLVSAKKFTDVDGFDELFWNGYEDVDLCFKLRQQGYKIIYQPASEVIHHESKSGPERFSKVAENIHRLHQKWLAEVSVDFILKPDGTVKEGEIINIRAYGKNKPVANEHENQQDHASIIMLTCNAREMTQKCVNSILKNTRFPYEIIFVDNGSKDGTVKYLEKIIAENKHFKLIKNKSNRGFSAGNNQGVEQASGKYIVLLNNDVLVAEGWLEDLVNSFEKDQKIGMVGVLTNKASGLQMLQGLSYKDDAGFEEFAGEWRKKYHGHITPRRRLAGLAMLTSKSLYESIGGFDESYGLGNFEDDDISLKVRQAGYALMVHEGTFIHHYGHSSFKANNIDLLESLKENEKIFRKKWPQVDYDELLELKNPLHEIHPEQIKEAELLIEQNKFTEAEAIFTDILQLNPVSGEALLGIALTLNLQGRFDEADGFLHKANNHHPENIIVLNQLGISAFRKSDFSLAENYFARVIMLNPEYVDAQRNYGRALIEKGDYENGVTAFLKILAKSPDDIVSLNYLAELFIEIEKYDNARQLLEKAQKTDPFNDNTNALLEQVNSILNGTQNPIIKDDDLNMENSLYLRAMELLNDFKPSEAEALFRQSYDIEKNPDALFGIALCAVQKEQTIKAIGELNKLLQLYPDYAPAYNQLGLVYFKNEEIENAKGFFIKAIEKDRNLVSAQRNYGLCLIELEDYQNGIAVFDKILTKNPQDTETLLILAGFYCEVEKWAEAETITDKILTIEPENEDALRLGELIRENASFQE